MSRIRHRRSWLFWSLQTSAWLALGLFTTSAVTATHPGLIPVTIARALAGFLATSLVLRPVLKRTRMAWRGHPVRQLAAAAGLVAILATIVSALLFELWPVLGVIPDSESTMIFFRIGFYIHMVTFALWSACYLATTSWLDEFESRKAAEELAACARESELNLLRAQINPHFLFNALNSILAVADHPQLVVSTTEALADFLRFSIKPGRPMAPLDEELAALQTYLQVEKTRFQDRLEFRMEIDPAASHAMVPSTVVQPLLENALKFGQQTSPPPLRIQIQARCHARMLEITVKNSGSWCKKGASGSTGIGLENLRRRLNLTYGGKASLEFETPEGFVLARLRLPLEEPAT